MERKITNELLRWKKDARKPLLLYGPKQVGKTYTVLEFGKKNYKNVVYFNTDNYKELIDILKREKSPEKIIMKLSVLSGETIMKEDTLIIFDNVNDPYIVKAIKLFSTEDNLYHIIMITSRKENLNKFKGEELYFKAMYPMDFEEFLANSDKKQLINFIKDSYLNNTKMPFHQMALDVYNDYLITGGMPEVVDAYFKGSDFLILESIKQKIIDVIKKEMILARNLIDIPRSNEVYDSIACQLMKDNKKFQYGNIKKGSRSKDYESSINTLGVNQLINRSFKLNDVKSPLSSNKDEESFKLYTNDVGILYTLMHASRMKFMSDDNLRRTLIENNTANTLVMLGYSLYYYQSEGKTEICFIVQNRVGEIIPIEILNMNLTKAKALTTFISKFKVGKSIRLTDDNFGVKKNIKYVPVYAAFCLKDM